MVARFLIRKEQFWGTRSKDDVRDILRFIDSAEYPPGSGWTWTRFFIPAAWNLGVRLEPHADTLFRLTAHNMSDMEIARGLPTRQIFHTIRDLIYGIAETSEKPAVITEMLWKSAVDEARILEAQLLMHAQNKSRKTRAKI
jgi:hypothetical protein